MQVGGGVLQPRVILAVGQVSPWLPCPTTPGGELGMDCWRGDTQWTWGSQQTTGGQKSIYLVVIKSTVGEVS